MDLSESPPLDEDGNNKEYYSEWRRAFNGCDENNTDFVPASKLIQIIESSINSEFLNELQPKNILGEFKNLLDPNGTDCSVNSKTFLKVMNEWCKKNFSLNMSLAEINNEAQNSPNSSRIGIPVNTHSTPRPSIGEKITKDKEFLELSNVSVGYSLSSSQLDHRDNDKTVLEEEIRRLEHQLQKNSTDLQMAQQLILTSEDQNLQLQQEVERLNKKLHADQQTIEQLQQKLKENYDLLDEIDALKCSNKNLEKKLKNSEKECLNYQNLCINTEDQKSRCEENYKRLKLKYDNNLTNTVKIQVDLQQAEEHNLEIMQKYEELNRKLSEQTLYNEELRKINILSNQKKLKSLRSNSPITSSGTFLVNRKPNFFFFPSHISLSPSIDVSTPKDLTSTSNVKTFFSTNIISPISKDEEEIPQAATKNPLVEGDPSKSLEFELYKACENTDAFRTLALKDVLCETDFTEFTTAELNNTDLSSRNKFEDLAREKAELEYFLNASINHRGQCEEAISEQEKTLQSLLVDKQHLECKNKRLSQIINAHKSENEDLKKQFEDIHAENLKFKEIHVDQEISNSKVELICELKNKLADNNYIQNELWEDVKCLENKLALKKSEINEILQKNNELEKQVEILEEEKIKIQEKLETQIKCEAEQHEIEMNNKDFELEKHENKLKETNLKLEKLNAQIQSEAQQHQIKLNNKDLELAKRENVLKETNLKLEKLDAQIKSEAEQHQIKLNNKDLELAKRENELKETNNLKLEEVNKENKLLAEKLSELTVKLEESNDRIIKLNEIKTNLIGALNKSDQRLKIELNNIKSLLDTISKLKTEHESLKMDFKETEIILKQTSAKIIKAKEDELEELHLKIFELEEQIFSDATKQNKKISYDKQAIIIEKLTVKIDKLEKELKLATTVKNKYQQKFEERRVELYAPTTTITDSEEQEIRKINKFTLSTSRCESPDSPSVDLPKENSPNNKQIKFSANSQIGDNNVRSRILLEAVPKLNFEIDFGTSADDENVENIIDHEEMEKRVKALTQFLNANFNEIPIKIDAQSEIYAKQYDELLTLISDISYRLRDHVCIGTAEPLVSVYILLEEMKIKIKQLVNNSFQIGALINENQSKHYWNLLIKYLDQQQRQHNEKLYKLCNNPSSVNLLLSGGKRKLSNIPHQQKSATLKLQLQKCGKITRKLCNIGYYVILAMALICLSIALCVGLNFTCRILSSEEEQCPLDEFIQHINIGFPPM